MSEYAIGIDLGGTKIAGASVAPDGTILAETRLPTLSEEGVDPVIGRIVACIRDLEAQAADTSTGTLAGIGLGAAGATDSRSGVVIMASNLKWKNVPLRDLLLARLGASPGLPVRVDKDTNAAVLGEMLFGAGRGTRHLFYATVGTGVGGGMVLDGRLYHGATEGASDLGHLVLEPDGILCGCGKHGCLETLSSGPAIARQAREALAQGRASSLSAIPAESLTAVEVVEAAQAGDALALDVLAQAGHYLGVALAYYLDLNNPELIVVGGGVPTAAGDLFLEPVRRTMAARALPYNAQAVRLTLPGLGKNAGAVGAAALVWHHLAD
jgi:glucokinase